MWCAPACCYTTAHTARHACLLLCSSGRQAQQHRAADRQGRHEEVRLPASQCSAPEALAPAAGSCSWQQASTPGAGSSALQLRGLANPSPAALADHLEGMGIHRQSAPVSWWSLTARVCPSRSTPTPPKHQQQTAAKSATESPLCIEKPQLEGLQADSMGRAVPPHLTCWRLQPAIPAAATRCPPRRAGPAGTPPTCWAGRTGARRCSHPCRRWRCPHLAGLCHCCRCPGV